LSPRWRRAGRSGREDVKARQRETESDREGRGLERRKTNIGEMINKGNLDSKKEKRKAKKK